MRHGLCQLKIDNLSINGAAMEGYSTSLDRPQVKLKHIDPLIQLPVRGARQATSRTSDGLRFRPLKNNVTGTLMKAIRLLSVYVPIVKHNTPEVGIVAGVSGTSYE